MKVLAVEDDHVSRAVLCQSLVRLRYEVIEAVDGEQGWEAWLREKPRVVVCDWQMPGIDGLDLCRRLRSQPSQEYIYFILLTARGDSAQNRRDAADAGVDDFMPKPINISALWMRLRVAERILKYTTQLHRLDDADIAPYYQKNKGRQQLLAADRGYINESTGTEISHSVCPDCYKRGDSG